MLYFDNNTGDASLDWMRTGLTDMMVTDLSQSTDSRSSAPIGSCRSCRSSDERMIASCRPTSSSEIAHRAAVDNVLVGSYVKAGGTIRISARLRKRGPAGS